ncbi:MAG: dTDP-4-dehydrorhamnose 3,5-epimerase [Alphaproteobacteria bacterium]|nr:dTDP-4-dehydrorhamnose 3,5-epimerase [Alphaproteobacteria bacterium]NCB49484.1 dTDP-4-dehydrorhamnose 3,5-epimerase [Alphaproteobacteria bacterium]
MIFEEKEIKGVFLIKPTIYKDSRGFFFESYSKKEFEKVGIKDEFVQDNISSSSYGVVRGLHFQKGEFAQSKLIRVLKGKVLDVIVDLRKNSPTFGQYVAEELSEENNYQLYVPRGFAHGFSVLSEQAVFTYKCDNFYNKESEGGVYFADKDLGIDWKVPEDKWIISDKDKLWKGINDASSYRF